MLARKDGLRHIHYKFMIQMQEDDSCARHHEEEFVAMKRTRNDAAMRDGENKF